jgi:hypothetical protein
MARRCLQRRRTRAYDQAVLECTQQAGDRVVSLAFMPYQQGTRGARLAQRLPRWLLRRTLRMAAQHARSACLGGWFHRGTRLSGAAMMVRPPHVPVDLQARTRFVKERVERAITELEQIAELTDPIFVSPRDVALNLWRAEREIVNAYIAMKSAWWP